MTLVSVVTFKAQWTEMGWDNCCLLVSSQYRWTYLQKVRHMKVKYST